MFSQKKILPYLFLFAAALLLWYTWVSENAPQPIVAKDAAVVPATTSPSVPMNTTDNIPSVPQTTQSSAPSVANTPTTPSKNLIHVKTNVLDIFIDPQDGNIVQSSLLNYPQDQKNPTVPLALFNSDPKYLYQQQSGFLSQTGEKQAVVYSADQQNYVLADDQSSLTVTLNGKTNTGVIFTKTYTFVPSSYVIDLHYAINNKSASSWSGYYYSQLVRTNELPDVKDDTSRYTFFGAATSTPDQHYDKVSFDSMEKEPVDLRDIQNGWVAMLQHYFVSSIVPSKDEKVNFYSNVNNAQHLFTIGVLSPLLNVAVGQQYQANWQLYSGPAIAQNLESVAPNLKLTIDYGWLWFISNLLFWLMQKIYDVVGNWGWSIVLVTVVIKAVFYKLSAKSYRSMAAMKRLQPHIKSLQERFKDDKQQLSREMMGLYKREKVNPLGGCLPMLVQIPVFIALYWVIVESVQLRQAPFMFWIHDLAIKDPYYILPVIMGLTMFIQQKISPPPPDPVQAKVMMLLPVVFTVFFLQFPAGLVLYWIVNNTLSIAQQWYMMNKYGDKKSVKKIEKKRRF